MAETFVEGAVNGKDGSGLAYCVLWDHYAAYKWAADRVVDGVQSLQVWGFLPTFVPLPTPGLAPGTRIDGALKGRKGYSAYSYFFRADKYARYDWNAPGINPPGESDTSAGWGFPASFGNVI